MLMEFCTTKNNRPFMRYLRARCRHSLFARKTHTRGSQRKTAVKCGLVVGR